MGIRGNSGPGHRPGVGGLWRWPGLDRPTRSLLTVALLTALRAHGELRGHVRGALRNGATRTEITETIIHTLGYAGAPDALSEMSVVQAVFDEQDGPGQDGAIRRGPNPTISVGIRVDRDR